MKRIGTIFLAFILLLGTMGCNDKQEGAKNEAKKEEKKEDKQTVQQTKGISQRFNHSASLKISQLASQIPEIQDPIVVVYKNEGVMAYKLKGDANPDAVNKKLKQKLKAETPEYQIFISEEPQWYQRVAGLYQETIDSEGKVVKDLRKTFDVLKDHSKK